MSWEIDWTHEGNTGSKVWARNPDSRIKKAREWHYVFTGSLRRYGVNVPTFRADSWEIDWERRDIHGKKVLARNTKSKMPSARDWHWVDQRSIQRAGMQWKPANLHSGRYIDSRGYVKLTRMGMTSEEIELATKHNLFVATRNLAVPEHRLIAVKKYGCIPSGYVVRHINGIKTDNRPENLLLGTTQENTADHDTARLLAMYWRGKYEEAILQFTGKPPDGTALRYIEKALE